MQTSPSPPTLRSLARFKVLRAGPRSIEGVIIFVAMFLKYNFNESSFKILEN